MVQQWQLHRSKVWRADVCGPSDFPRVGAVTVRKATLYAYDNNTTHNVFVRLIKTNPFTGSETYMASAESAGDFPTDPRELSTTSITYPTIQRAYGVHVRLGFYRSADLKGYAVKIAYTD